MIANELTYTLRIANLIWFCDFFLGKLLVPRAAILIMPVERKLTAIHCQKHKELPVHRYGKSKQMNVRACG